MTTVPVATRQFRNGQAIAILLCIIAIWFVMLGYRDLIDPDEGRYAEIPREMLASGNWITPRLNGYRYFEKPPLQYWLTAAGYWLLGENNASARLWPALAGFACSLWIGFLGLKLYGRTTAWYGFIICASSMLYFGSAHFLTLDTSLSLFILLALGSLVMAQKSRNQAVLLNRWMLCCWASVACAVLTKGPIGALLPGGAVVLYSLWQRDWRLWQHLRIIPGLALFLLITAPWFIAVSLENETFASFFFIHENWLRYTSPVHHHRASLFYFLPIFLIGCTPWIYQVMASLVRPGFSWWPDKTSTTFDPERLLWVFIVVVLLFFSLSASKLPTYILPALPAAALLAARRLASSGGVARDAVGLGLLAATVLTLAVMLPGFGSENIPEALFRACQPWVLATGIFFSCGALLLFLLRRQQLAAVTATAICAMLGYQCLMWGFQEISPSRSARVFAEKIAADRTGANVAEVYLVETLAPSLAFYLRRPLTLVAGRGEMAMGIELEPDNWVSGREGFVGRWNSDRQALAVIANKDLEHYLGEDLPADIIYRGPRRTLIRKPDINSQVEANKHDPDFGGNTGI